MPIKFRCNYCRQFLGISRAQAGGIVDCPTCGRSIRVPQLDGSLQPLPEPELNLQDAQLARALEELARLGSSDPQPVARQTQSDEELEEERQWNRIAYDFVVPKYANVPVIYEATDLTNRSLLDGTVEPFQLSFLNCFCCLGFGPLKFDKNATL